MKYSLQLSDAIHILAYIAIFQDSDMLSSEMIAKSIETSAANVRKIMSRLKKANLIITQVGKAAPSLARSPEKISLLDIYKRIEGNTNLIQVDPKTNPNCIVGANIQETLTASYTQLQAKVEEEMSHITLDSLLHKIAVLEIEKRPHNHERIKKFL